MSKDQLDTSARLDSRTRFRLLFVRAVGALGLVLPVIDVGAEVLRRAALRLSMVTDPCVVHDAIQPCGQTRSFTKGVKMSLRAAP